MSESFKTITRQEASERLNVFYSGLIEFGIRHGHISETSSENSIEKYLGSLPTSDNFAPPDKRRVGDDLTDEDLDLLWDHISGEGYFGWYEDKPHQITHRLLLRLTRAEKELAEANDLIRELKGSV